MNTKIATAAATVALFAAVALPAFASEGGDWQRNECCGGTTQVANISGNTASSTANSGNNMQVQGTSTWAGATGTRSTATATGGDQTQNMTTGMAGSSTTQAILANVDTCCGCQNNDCNECEENGDVNAESRRRRRGDRCCAGTTQVAWITGNSASSDANSGWNMQGQGSETGAEAGSSSSHASSGRHHRSSRTTATATATGGHQTQGMTTGDTGSMTSQWIVTNLKGQATLPL